MREDKKWHDEQLETIIKKAEAHMRRFKKVPDPQKVVKFTFLQKDALEIARNMQMNIKTERKEDDLWGTIETVSYTHLPTFSLKVSSFIVSP